MLELYKNIKKRRKELGLTQEQLASLTGYSGKSMIAKIEGGKVDLPQSKITEFAKALKTTEGTLMGWLQKDNDKNTTRASRIPVLGRVRCGIPLDAIEDVIDYEEVPEKMNYDGKLFGLRVKGDSMYPPIRDGDTLIVHEQPDAETNEIVIAMVNGNEATCKELKKVDDGIMLVPWNRDYDAMFFSWQQVQELPVRIVGKVVEFRSKV